MDNLNDKNAFHDVQKALTILEFTKKEQKEIFALVASVLHLGNVGFTVDEGTTLLSKTDSVEIISEVGLHCYLFEIEFLRNDLQFFLAFGCRFRATNKSADPSNHNSPRRRGYNTSEP